MKSSQAMQIRQGLEHAYFSLQNGEPAKTEMRCLELLKSVPDQSDALLLLALSRLQQGKADAALQPLNALIRKDKKSAQAYLLRGNCFFQLNDLSAAEQDYKKSIAIDAKNIDAYQNIAAVHFAQGHVASAIDLIEHAIDLNPLYDLLHFNKGKFLEAANAPDRALASYETAIRLNGNYAEAYLNRGNLLKNLGSHQEALESYSHAIRINPNYAGAYNNRGAVLLLMERFEQALDDFSKAAQLRPDFAEAHFNRGTAFKHLNRLDTALTSFDKALSLRADYIEAYIGKAETLSGLNRVEDAAAIYAVAIGIRPDHVATTIGMARLEQERGDFIAAERLLNAARDMDCNLVEPLIALAALKKYSPGDPLFRQITDRLADDRLAQRDRARLLHSLGKVSNDIGDYDAAFAYFLESKKYRNSNFSIAQCRDHYSGLRDVFTAEFFAARRHFGCRDQRPVFVVGMPRSGTSLVEQILSSHPHVAGLGELNDLPNCIHDWEQNYAKGALFSAAIAMMTDDQSRIVAEAYCRAFQSVSAAKTRIIDKRPHNFELLGVIALLFPDAHIIHCRRNPLDTCVSIFMQDFNETHGYNQDLDVLGHYYREYEILMAHWADTLPLSIETCNYEDLVGQFEPTVRRLVSHIGLDWSDACLDFDKTARHVRTPSLWQVRQPLYSSSVGVYKRYEAHLRELESALGSAAES